jgi:hypothetical protein
MPDWWRKAYIASTAFYLRMRWRDFRESHPENWQADAALDAAPVNFKRRATTPTPEFPFMATSRPAAQALSDGYKTASAIIA